MHHETEGMPVRSARLIVLIAALAVACSSPPPPGGSDASQADTARDDRGSADAQLGDSAEGDGSVADGFADAAPAIDAATLDAGTDLDTGAVFDASQPFVYVGSSNGNISVYALDSASGNLTPRGQTAAGSNPSFLAVDPSHRHLYAVNEGGNAGQVAAFEIDPASGALRFLNRVSSEGRGPAHLSVDATGRWVLVANYGDGAVAVLPIQADGRLGPAADSEAPGMNAHLIITDPANRFAFVPCLGSNLIAQFAFDATSGALTPNSVPSVASMAGAGPRHLAFHPSARWAYAINERNSTMTTYAYDAATGRLTASQTLSTLPAGYSGSNTCAEVAVHPSGRFVLGSNRGHDSIVVFAVDDTSGALSLIGHTPTGGQTPRHFGLTPDGSLLLVANQQSEDVFAFRVEVASGGLTSLGRVAQVNRPAYVGVVTLP